MTSTLALFGGPKTIATPHTKWPVVRDADKDAVMRVLDRGVLSGMFAPEAVALERAFGSFAGAKHAQLTHSGTSALQVALSAAGVGEGDEVVMPAYSFVATPLAAVLIGAIPIFVDVDPVHGNLDAKAIEAALSPRTKAIMPVHVHGTPCDLDDVLAIARARGVIVIEDAAQAHGATYKGKPVGALGAAGGFSLQSSKNLSGGEGGIFVTNDDAIADAARRLRSFGQDIVAADAAHFDPTHPLDGHRALGSQRVGSMYRGNEMMAAFVRSQLERLPELTRRARASYELLRKGLGELPGVSLPAIPADRESSHHKVRVHLDVERAGVKAEPRALRDATMKALAAEGLEVVLWQNDPLPAQALFRGPGFGKGFPWSSGDAARARENYDPARYPATTRMLASSFLLFSQSHPFIAQEPALVAKYVEAFAKVWHHRRELVERAA